ncbi:hypothetical protein STENM36S_00233 [Streptomyces tendae]
MLAEAGDGTFTAAGHPEILDLLMVVWNKVYRRDFVEREGFTFPPGYYEDTPWTFPVMFSAERIAALDRICLNYRQRRQGNILSTTSRKHFDVHAQYERVFAFLDARPELAARWRPFLHAKMGEHCLDILSKPDRLPPSDRAEFFHRTAEMFRAHRPEGAAAPAELRVLEGSYAAYRLRRQSGRAAREAERRTRQARGAVAARARRVAAALPAAPWTPASSCTRRSPTGACSATPPRSTAPPVNSRRTCAGCGWCGTRRARRTPPCCRRAPSTWSWAVPPTAG